MAGSRIMNTEHKLDFAKALAAYAHQGQKDKAGKPYIFHPLAVAEKMEGETEKVVAVLHDVMEDSNVEFMTLYNLFGYDIANAVKALTKESWEPYMVYIQRVGENPLARKVKLADLEHNMDLGRLHSITDKDRERTEKYKKAYDYLKSIPDGRKEF